LPSKCAPLDPNLVPAYTSRGLAYVIKGDHDRAIADFSKAIELDPKYALAYGSRGLAYARVEELLMPTPSCFHISGIAALLSHARGGRQIGGSLAGMRKRR
jgi:tetratricopeptide (TPR) repeat protein